MLTYYLLAISEYFLSRSLIYTQCLQIIAPYKMIVADDCPLQEIVKVNLLTSSHQ